MSGTVAGEDETAWWAQYRDSGSIGAREKLFTRHAAFARNIARRHHREQSHGDIDLLDLQQLAYAGLLEALDRFDPTKGVPFRAFAAHRISGSVRDGIARMSEVREQISWRHRVRRERLRSLSEGAALSAMEKLSEIAVGLALGFMLEGTPFFIEEDEGLRRSIHPATAYDSVAWNDIVTRLGSELQNLPEREQVVLRQHYLNGIGFDEIAALLSLSKGRVSQLHRMALQRLRKKMNNVGHFHLDR